MGGRPHIGLDVGHPLVTLVRLDNRTVREVLDRGYADAADATGSEPRPTFPVGRPVRPITIDHILVPSPIRVHRVSVHEIRDSDHRALVAELVLPPG